MASGDGLTSARSARNLARQRNLVEDLGGSYHQVVGDTIPDRLLEFARGVTVLVRVFDERDAGWIRELGGVPVVYSEAAAEEMLKWFDNVFTPAAVRRES